MLTTVLLGIAGGVALAAMGVPAGALIGSVAAVGIYNVVSNRAAKMPTWVRVVARIIMGTVIGSVLTREMLGTMGVNLVWAMLFTFVMLGVGVVAGLVLARIVHMDRATALMSTCPGGMSELAVLSDQLGVGSEMVLGIHLARKILTLVVTAVILAGSQVLT